MAPSVDATPFPVRLLNDRRDDRLRIVVDAHPAGIDDLSVAAGPARVHIEIDHDDGRHERTVSPLPNHRVFGDAHSAVYNNGVLEITLETASRFR